MFVFGNIIVGLATVLEVDDAVVVPDISSTPLTLMLETLVLLLPEIVIVDVSVVDNTTFLKTEVADPSLVSHSE